MREYHSLLKIAGSETIQGLRAMTAIVEERCSFDRLLVLLPDTGASGLADRLADVPLMTPRGPL